ncbi:MAG TPA: hypothetical protein PLA85_07110 [Micropepsaceae bacterium]|nr:hypothetical protein [Micropepsaceae bacterium]HRK71339.1 hypothetical protein [Micropepsaceae bacterium]
MAARAPLLPDEHEGEWSLTGVIAVMCFLACLTLGIALAVSRASAVWSEGLSGTGTILVPADGLVSPEDGARAVADAVRRLPGIAEVRIVSRAESDDMLRPWLGNVSLDGLPLPVLVAVSFEGSARPANAEMEAIVAAASPGALWDDHGVWREDLQRLSAMLSAISLGVLVLIALAAVATIVFATRAGLESHREIVEVLHHIGARNQFIAHEFERRFLLLGLKAGALGLLLAVGVLLLFANTDMLASGGEFYLPRLSLAASDWPWLVAVPLATSLIATVTARLTVMRVIGRMP